MNAPWIDSVNASSFDGFGTPDLGGTVQVQAGDFVRTVTVDAVSGEVMVQ